MVKLANLPLNAMRAFTAAASHTSLAEAADELNVTQGAVSRQIKALEEHLGFPLFDRSQRRLTLTRKGEMLLPAFQDAFGQLTQAMREANKADEELRIKVPPSLAVRWLIPQLHLFQTSHPEIDINLTTSWHFFDPDTEDFNAGIIYAVDYIRPEPRPSLRFDEIAEEWMVPLCAPSYLETAPPLDTVDDLANHTLLNCLCFKSHDDWSYWLEQFGYPDLKARKMVAFDYLDIALHAAASGQGIVLGDISLVKEDMAAGRLVAPLDVPPLKVGSYYLVSHRRAEDHPHLETFRQWLQDPGHASAGTGHNGHPGHRQNVK
ncbi:LysR substrate-binding domain-containing protein [Aestuariispira ectoiniformans]|uniref:LysR substrate-binding domain-containing protein n=1 Tax=Aestuariispira ectoiniformans TaxID=2775080 RepID=UPI00223BD420|nr:LysR substrate-binding domain-containing protein [Aestuariispira ectoiniformans]